MLEGATIQLNGANVALLLFVVGHLGITIAWASRVSTILSIIQVDFSALGADIKMLKEQFVSKELHELEVQALWRRMDENKVAIETLQKRSCT